METNKLRFFKILEKASKPYDKWLSIKKKGSHIDGFNSYEEYRAFVQFFVNIIEFISELRK